MIKKIGMPLLLTLIIISLGYSLIYYPFIKSNNYYVIISDKEIFKVHNNKWSKISNRNINRLSFGNSYSINNNRFIGKTYLNSSKDNLEIYDNTYQKISVSDTLITINTNKKIEDIKIASFFDSIDDVDMNNVNNILKRYSLENEMFNLNLKYIADLNNDGNDDIIYSISNFYDTEDKSKAFSIIFSCINDNLEVIDEVIVDKADELNSKSLYLKNISDIDIDDKYELIVANTSYGNDNVCYSIYRYDTSSNNFVKLIEC